MATKAWGIPEFDKRRLFFARGVARQSKEQLSSRVMFGTIAGRGNPRPDGQCKTWHKCIIENLKEFPAAETSTEVDPPVFGLQPGFLVHCSQKGVEVVPGDR